MKRPYLEILLHIIFWSLCYYIFLISFSFYLVRETDVNGKTELIHQTIYLYESISATLLSFMFVVYLNAYLLFPKFLHEKKVWKYSLLVLALIAASFFLKFAFSFVFQTVLSESADRYPSVSISLLIFFQFFFWGLSCAYVLGKRYLKNEQLKQQLIQEKLAAELQFLKAQIHPHFLFNTLNNLYAIAAQSKHPELSRGIAELSNLMRYMLYEAKAKCVPLEKEIAHIKSIIEIQQMRYHEDDEIWMSFQINGEVGRKEIAPLLLVPFVENAFKHGIAPGLSSFIKIELNVTAKELKFVVSNSNLKKNNTDLDQHQGIGLENVKRRLALIYPERHLLHIEENEKLYRVSLNLEIN